MDLSTAQASFEARFASLSEEAVYHPDTVALLSGGIQKEGDRSPAWCSDDQTAVRLWFEAATNYARQYPDTGTLIWRVRPEIYSAKWAPVPAIIPGSGDESRTFFKVYSRFRIECP